MNDIIVNDEEKFCVNCKYCEEIDHRYMCWHPFNISVVDGRPRYDCETMRYCKRPNNEDCIGGNLFEAGEHYPIWQLLNADPNCQHEIISTKNGKICTRCNGRSK